MISKSLLRTTFLITLFLLFLTAQKIFATSAPMYHKACKFDFECTGFVEKDPSGQYGTREQKPWLHCGNKKEFPKIIEINPGHLYTKDDNLFCECDGIGLCKVVDVQSQSLIYKAERFFYNLLTLLYRIIFRIDSAAPRPDMPNF